MVCNQQLLLLFFSYELLFARTWDMFAHNLRDAQRLRAHQLRSEPLGLGWGDGMQPSPMAEGDGAVPDLGVSGMDAGGQWETRRVLSH